MPMIATDGSSLGGVNAEGKRIGEGPGAFGVVVRFEADHPRAPGFVQTHVGGRRSTTTGEIELLGFLCALETVRAYKEARDADPDNSMLMDGDHFTIVLDSEYVAKSFTDHLDGWADNKWRSNGFRAIKHQVHWQDVYDLRAEVGHLVSIVHTRGHTKRATDVEVDPIVEINDEADKAAGLASRAIRDTGVLPRQNPVVWAAHAAVMSDRDADIRRLRSLAEMVLTRHGRAAAVEAFKLATAATGIKE